MSNGIPRARVTAVRADARLFAITSALPVSRPSGNRVGRRVSLQRRSRVSRDQRAVSLLSNRKRIPRERYNIISRSRHLIFVSHL